MTTHAFSPNAVRGACGAEATDDGDNLATYHVSEVDCARCIEIAERGLVCGRSVNREGLTLGQWVRYARARGGADSIGNRSRMRVLARAWRLGEDPTEYAAPVADAGVPS